MFNTAQLHQVLPVQRSLNQAHCLWNDLDKSRKTLLKLLACLCVIVGISVYDSWLVVLFKDCILFDERNPICVALIKQDPSSLSWFLAGKLAGNVFVVSMLIGLYSIGYRHTLVVARSVMGFQIALLMFLQFSDSATGFLWFDNLWSYDREEYYAGVRNLGIHSIGAIAILSGIAFKIRRK